MPGKMISHHSLPPPYIRTGHQHLAPFCVSKRIQSRWVWKGSHVSEPEQAEQHRRSRHHQIVSKRMKEFLLRKMGGLGKWWMEKGEVFFIELQWTNTEGIKWIQIPFSEHHSNPVTGIINRCLKGVKRGVRCSTAITSPHPYMNASTTWPGSYTYDPVSC